MKAIGLEGSIPMAKDKETGVATSSTHLETIELAGQVTLPLRGDFLVAGLSNGPSKELADHKGVGKDIPEGKDNTVSVSVGETADGTPVLVAGRIKGPTIEFDIPEREDNSVSVTVEETADSVPVPVAALINGHEKEVKCVISSLTHSPAGNKSRLVGNNAKDMGIVRMVPRDVREEGEAECIANPTHSLAKAQSKLEYD